jgi:RNA polymerase sigma factor for flagellar operon FliA
VKADTESIVVHLWQEFKETGSPEARERLILHYSPLVKYVAGRVGSNLPSNVEQADLISYGFFGLIDAISKFDPGRNIKFETYAIPRVRGAIIDELRALDWVPRSVRSKARQLERTYSRLEGKLKRAPTDEEVAEEVGISVGELQATLLDISQTSIVALDDVRNVGDKGDTITLMETIEDKRAEEPGDGIELAELKSLLVEAIGDLPDKEKQVISLYYYNNLTLKEIGDIMGVTESRICQMHARAVLRLRSKLRAAVEG